MKNVNMFFLVTLFLFNFSELTLVAQEVELTESWSGEFMGQFKLEIEFQKNSNGHYTGILTMFDGPQQIQHDELTKIKLEGEKIYFFIPAKTTPFEGKISENGKVIEGEFIFPDNSRHPLLINAVVKGGVKPSENEKDYLSIETSKNLLIQDIYFISEKLKELHPALFYYQPHSEFEATLNKTIAAIRNDMTIFQFYIKIAPFVSSIGCSHCGIRLPEQALKFLQKRGNYFPARLLFTKNSAFLVSSYGNKIMVPSGSKLKSINGKTIPEIIDEIFSLIPSEGGALSSRYYEINTNFSDYYVLLDNSENFKIQFKDNLKEEEIESCSYEEVQSLIFNNKASQVNVNEFPIKFSLNKKENTAYLRIPTFGYSDINRYIFFMDSAFTELNDSGIENLVIDLRGNSGGHPIFAAQLFSYLTDKSFTYFDTIQRVEEFAPLYSNLQPNPIHFSGNNYILINGGCLSTTGHLISLLKYHQLSVVIGEEPGSSFRCCDNSRQFVLPNSGIEINIPTTIFQTAVNGIDKNSVFVDYPVTTDWQDILESHDPFLDASREINSSQ